MTTLTHAAPTSSSLTGRLRVTTIDPIRHEGWDNFVDSNAKGMVFHHSSWAKVLAESYGYQPFCHVIESESGEIVAGLPVALVQSRLTGTRLVSMPFTDYCPPLFQTGEHASNLVEHAQKHMRDVGAKRLEIRGWPDSSESPSEMTRVTGYVRHVLDLEKGIDAVRSDISENARRSLKKAAAFGVYTRMGSSLDDLSTFYGLNLLLRRKHGMLPQPRRFFEAIFRNVVQPGYGYFLLAERSGVTIAGQLCFRNGDTVLDKYAVNRPELSEYRGSHAVMWSAIETAATRGAHFYDMGRSDAEAIGLHRFKEQWGAIKLDASYFHFPAAGGMSTEDPKGLKKLALSTFARFAPDSIFGTAGSLAYRHLG